MTRQLREALRSSALVRRARIAETGHWVVILTDTHACVRGGRLPPTWCVWHRPPSFGPATDWAALAEAPALRVRLDRGRGRCDRDAAAVWFFDGEGLGDAYRLDLADPEGGSGWGWLG